MSYASIKSEALNKYSIEGRLNMYVCIMCLSVVICGWKTNLIVF